MMTTRSPSEKVDFLFGYYRPIARLSFSSIIKASPKKVGTSDEVCEVWSDNGGSDGQKW